MARLAGNILPNNKKIEVALTYIYGIGISRSRDILNNLNIDLNKKIKDLTEDEINKIREEISQYKLEGDLRRSNVLAIRRLKEINCYRGMRHARHLPARGQRTRVNSRTVRGNVRRTMGSGRKPPTQKT
jgi:small subunit ribosomal protein S13